MSNYSSDYQYDDLLYTQFRMPEDSLWMFNDDLMEVELINSDEDLAFEDEMQCRMELQNEID